MHAKFLTFLCVYSDVTPVRGLVASASESSPNTVVDITWKPPPKWDIGTRTSVEIKLQEPGKEIVTTVSCPLTNLHTVFHTTYLKDNAAIRMTMITVPSCCFYFCDKNLASFITC